MPLNVGDKLGPYEILALIGKGGMGEVYRAHDPRLGRDVAIKVSAARFSERFEREARLIASLNHPNICTLYDVGPNYLVMEYIEGESPKGPMPLDEALRIARQIADALEAAHEKPIIHRDLKPANIKIKPDGLVKVLDFGLAKMHELPGEDGDTVPMGLTDAGAILGTPAYMSPEQAVGKKADKRADIWSFGVVLYELLTGERPFKGKEVGDILESVVKEQPDLSRAPAKVQRLLASCLEKDRTKRLQAIGDWRLPLEDAPPPAPEKTQWLWPAVAGLCFVAAAALAMVHFSEAPPAAPRPVTRWSVVLPAGSTGVALSRDGTELAYEASGKLWLRKLDQVEAQPVSGSDGGTRPFFSPDGQWLVYFSQGLGPLKKIPVTGGSPITLCDRAIYAGGSWSDGGSIVFSDAIRLMRGSAAGGACEPLTKPDPQTGEGHVWPQFLPGGQSVLFTIGVLGAYDSARIAVLDLKTGKYRVVVNGGANARYVPSGHLVYARGKTLFAVPFDLKRMQVTGTETPVAEGVFYNSIGGFADYAFSDSGLLVYVAGTPADATGRILEWVDLKGAEQPLPAPPQTYRDVRLSPDGQRAALAFSSSTGGNPDIWISDLARGTLTHLTSQGFNDRPVWTPDSRRVVFRTSPVGMYWTPADGSGKPEALLKETEAIPNSWTPDGKTLLYTDVSGGKSHIWVLPGPGSGGGKPRLLFGESAFNESDALLSPDGRWVAYASDESGKNQVYLRPYPGPGGVTTVSINGGQQPMWSHDGRELFFVDGGTLRVMVVDIETNPALRLGRPRALFDSRNVIAFDLAPDGKRFLVAKTPEAAAKDRGDVKLQVVENWFEELRRKAPEGKK